MILSFASFNNYLEQVFLEQPLESFYEFASIIYYTDCKNLLKVLFACDLNYVLEKKFSISFWTVIYHLTKVCSEPSQTSKMEVLTNKVNDFYTLTIFTKSFILDV